jgi:hypothetical protein
MNKVVKVLLILAFITSALLFGSWKVFNHYWRTNSTVNTFGTFTEGDVPTPTKIKWVEGTYGSVTSPISAFFVEVQLNGISDSFYMQFDTGTPQTVLYGKTINKLNEKYPTLNLTQSESGNYWLESADLKIGRARLQAEQLLARPTMGSDSLDSNFIIIGSIGFDAILNKKLILDFKNNLLTLTNKDINQPEYAFKNVEGANLHQFPILLPAIVDGEKVQLQFDSGSSMFSLIMDNQKLADLKNADEIDTLCCITSWGKSFDFYRRKLETNIKIGNITEDKPYVYSSNSMNQYSYFPNWLMMGQTGNKIFIGKILLIDTDNNIFAISN